MEDWQYYSFITVSELVKQHENKWMVPEPHFQTPLYLEDFWSVPQHGLAQTVTLAVAVFYQTVS